MIKHTVLMDISRYLLPLSTYEIFGNMNKTALEIGFGEGEFIAETASVNPTWNFIGIEVKYYRCQKAVKLVRNKNLHNVKLVHCEASVGIQEIFKNYTIDKVYINFPDPWPKERHIKHRLINDVFITQLHRIMKTGAELEFVTDSEDYIYHTIRFFRKYDGFSNITSGRQLDPDRPTTRFNEEFKLMNKKIRYLFYRKVAEKLNFD